MFEASSAYSFGSRLDIDYFPGILKAFAQVNDLGLDESSCGVVISWAFECFQRGIISKEDTGGCELSWGDHQVLNDLIRKIAYREGFGDLLAEGVMRASRKIGKGSEYYAPHVKGQDITDSIRSAKGWALGIVTATRSGRHNNGSPATEFQCLPPEVGQAVFGAPSAGDGRKYEGKAELVYWHEQFKASVDMLGVCYNTSRWANPTLLGPDDYAQLLSAATGRRVSGEELIRMGLKVHNIEKAINTIHAGFERKDDMPPRIFMEEPVKSGAMKGERLDKEKWDEMLNEYYRLHGWDLQTGWQKKDILMDLGLHVVTERLKAKGRLIE